MEMMGCMGFNHLYLANKSVFLKQFPSSGFWSLPISTCTRICLIKMLWNYSTGLCHGGPLTAGPFGL